MGNGIGELVVLLAILPQLAQELLACLVLIAHIALPGPAFQESTASVSLLGPLVNYAMHYTLEGQEGQDRSARRPLIDIPSEPC